jgi:hypothetical protein
MNALSERHAKLFDDLNCVVSELISASELRKILNTRMEQYRTIMLDASTDSAAQQARGGLDACRAFALDIDTILGRRR